MAAIMSEDALSRGRIVMQSAAFRAVLVSTPTVALVSGCRKFVRNLLSGALLRDSNSTPKRRA